MLPQVQPRARPAAARAPLSGACPVRAHCAPPSGAGGGGGAAGGFRPIRAGSAVTCSALGSRPAWCVKRIRRRRRRSITGRPVTNATGRLCPGGWRRWGEGGLILRRGAGRQCGHGITCEESCPECGHLPADRAPCAGQGRAPCVTCQCPLCAICICGHEMRMWDCCAGCAAVSLP